MEEYKGIIEERDGVYTRNKASYSLKDGEIDFKEAPNKLAELKKVLKTFTNDDNLTHYKPDIKIFREDKDNTLVCVCSKSKCGKLYKLRHKKSDKIFALGSSCITKEFDKTFTNKQYNINVNGMCGICNDILVFRSKTLTKNYKKDELIEDDGEIIKICIDCNIKHIIDNNKGRKCIDCDYLICDKNNHMLRCIKCWYLLTN